MKIYKKNKSGIIFFSIDKMIICYIKLNNPNFVFNNIPYYVFDIKITYQIDINEKLINEIINRLKNV